MPTNDLDDLYAMRWRLADIDDPAGTLGPGSVGHQDLRIAPRPEGSDTAGGVGAIARSGGGGMYAAAFVDHDHIWFSRWVSSLVGSFAAAPRRPGTGVADPGQLSSVK